MRESRRAAGGGLDDVDRVELRALGIDGIGDQPVVGAVGDAGDAEIGVRLGERIAVEQDLLLAAVARHAAEQRMLPADDEAAVIGEGAVRSRHAGVILLDTALHLGEQLRLELFRVGHDGLRVGVLGFEIGPDLGIERAGSRITACQLSARSQA